MANIKIFLSSTFLDHPILQEDSVSGVFGASDSSAVLNTVSNLSHKTEVTALSMKRKRKPLPPRRKRMSRQARLASARSWLMKFSGKNVVRSYANWFGVDLLCAVKELSLCGVAVDPAYVTQLKTTFASRSSRRPETTSRRTAVSWLRCGLGRELRLHCGPNGGRLSVRHYLGRT